MSKSTVISVENLKKYYGQTKAVDDISFTVEKGEIFGFLGPNGAGKTTTIRCMMDFLRPDEGRISILGLDSQIDATELKTKMGFLPGEINLYENWTGQEHIDLIRNIRDGQRYENELIDLLLFDPRKKVKELSSGNKQKLGLILALMQHPPVLILDEPTIGLDPLLQNTVYEILNSLVDTGSTVFMSSHNLAEVDRICNRVCIIKDGKIVAIERVDDLKKKRIYTATVFFEGAVPEDIQDPNIEIRKKFDGGLVLDVAGDPNNLVHLLSKHKIQDVEIAHASLEQVFLEFYK